MPLGEGRLEVGRVESTVTVRRSLRDSFGGWWGRGCRDKGHGLGAGRSSWAYTGHREESRQLRRARHWALGIAAAQVEASGPASGRSRGRLGRQSLREPLAPSRSNTHFSRQLSFLYSLWCPSYFFPFPPPHLITDSSLLGPAEHHAVAFCLEDFNPQVIRTSVVA